MAIPLDKKLYEKAKEIVYKQYDKPSAYRSGSLVKKYKSMGGKYKEDSKNKDIKPLERWFLESWKDINPTINKLSYPVYRPTKKVNEKTPLLVSEIDKKDLLKKIKEKQKIKGSKNLKPFKPKN